jgi:hypothetical protein
MRADFFRLTFQAAERLVLSLLAKFKSPRRRQQQRDKEVVRALCVNKEQDRRRFCSRALRLFSDVPREVIGRSRKTAFEASIHLFRSFLAIKRTFAERRARRCTYKWHLPLAMVSD